MVMVWLPCEVKVQLRMSLFSTNEPVAPVKPTNALSAVPSVGLARARILLRSTCTGEANTGVPSMVTCKPGGGGLHVLQACAAAASGAITGGVYSTRDRWWFSFRERPR